VYAIIARIVVIGGALAKKLVKFIKITTVMEVPNHYNCTPMYVSKAQESEPYFAGGG
jgi:hypothetical protein